ncbi:glutamate racemase [Bartonella bacilliformis str. Heidi Mejia]|uniref:Glutamate racemase n=2 Tax=Bartonella bacilliformis TaxID=774 RepID=MURI_BARBK|nr:glutamate racemase [Bartonella bacilliformis]A1UT12.1 RecName: Full=Glutamate racemase [Bartonella bacilliformis KC583]ABM45352.1 glutamate racemase [Bartonella bacilliformis KC583]AMG85908.1 glutamate racemase [Bartonella bacilliformis]EKS43850.1 glutamate racemase [Bartonella bacilliformis INS]EYS89881.1 glutamate racemase [Bartonella bacilliformis San Pedro600-02]EYS91944.1 glutamate racemase [Bartonella bacilliformis str. Heidi Mejia]
MSEKPVIFFDSGIGGLTVLKEARILIPELQFVYVADDAGFPYGAWEEDVLKGRILKVFTNLLKLYTPALCVIACNTASTLMISDLRQEFPHIPFVGTVPAIKSAAAQTKSGLISVLATPGTVKRAYTHELISSFANQCHVELVGSKKLATFAENYLRGYPIDYEELRHEILPCFVEKNGKYTDVIVLACTHYPFLISLFHKQALWSVNWIDPAKAIARHTRSLLLETMKNKSSKKNIKNYALFTSQNIDFVTERLLQRFNLNIMKGVDFGV